MDDLREKYIQGKLTEAEQKAFEQDLTPEERKELAFELGVRDGLEDQLRKELRNKVAGFESRKTRVRKLNPTYISIAASIFLVSSLILYFTRDQQSLFDQYYTVYPNYEVTTVRGEDDLSNREQAYTAYDVGNFNKAIEAFSELDSISGADYFFRSISFIQLNEYEKATSDLDQVISSNDKDYKMAAIWYTALIHLKLENEASAIPLLLELSKGNSEFASTSKKLLEQL